MKTQLLEAKWTEDYPAIDTDMNICCKVLTQGKGKYQIKPELFGVIYKVFLSETGCKQINLNLTPEDIFHFHNNIDKLMIRIIYQKLFPEKEVALTQNIIYDDSEEFIDSIPIPLETDMGFNLQLIEIIEKLNIKFEEYAFELFPCLVPNTKKNIRFEDTKSEIFKHYRKNNK